MFANSLYASLFTALGIAFGFIVAELVADPEPARPPVVRASAAPVAAPQQGQPGSGAEIAELRALLQDERRAREQLAGRVAVLDARLALLDAAANEEAAIAAAAESQAPDPPAETADERWFDEQALIDAGMPSEQAGELKRFFEQIEMQRLQLRDLARREDWERGRLRAELVDLNLRETDLREQYGEAAYDAYLYASGKTNRVEISSVLDSAPAAVAGIEGGDLIVSYDSRRIYNPRDLRDAIAGGDLSDTVEVEVTRDNRLLRFYFPRGPLGIRLNPLRVAP